ncbi:MAG: TetR family transcriptional regulator [Kaiparowitsia implicata GSE-PSE-MK54-09C]|jgi:AcrR family transcriptional regulator|nr:TetR family transcriptional regulator [Kaiparowitsia implicata GSE-PSE-MK54-09C]
MSYDERRVDVAEAVWRVIIREGLGRTSMRAIAQELGASTGTLTHHFRDKEELTLFAIDRLFKNVFADMKASAQGQQGIDRLEQMIMSVLPMSPRGLSGWQIWVAFLGYAIGRDRLIQEHQKRYAMLRQIIVQELVELQAARVIRDGLDLTLEANALIALVDGIGTGVVINPEQFDPEQQRYLVRRHIQTLVAESSARANKP